MLRLGGDHSFNPHVYLAEKSSSNNNSEANVDALLEAMTDRDSDDPISPSNSISQIKKQSVVQTPLNYQSTNRNSNTTTTQENYQYYPGIPNSQLNKNQQGALPQHYQAQLQQYRGNNSTISPWQIQDNNRNSLYNSAVVAPTSTTNSNTSTTTSSMVNSSRNGIGVNRLHADAGEFDPNRGIIEYYPSNHNNNNSNSSNNNNNTLKQRTDNYVVGVDINAVNRIPNPNQQQQQSQPMGGNSIAHQYTSYRKQTPPLQQQQQQQ